MNKYNLILAINPKTVIECKNEKEYTEWFSNFLNEMDSKLKENSVVAFAGYYGNEDISNKINAEWLSILNSLNTTNFAIGDIVVWKRNIEIPSNRENGIKNVCEPIFILCRKNEYRTYHLNVNEKTVKGNAHYHTPIYNNIATNGQTLEEDYKEIEQIVIDMYNPPKGKIYKPFEEK